MQAPQLAQGIEQLQVQIQAVQEGQAEILRHLDNM
jgi:X-X-X-Leu-X-X-Gly heptad repeat protein